MRPMASNNMLPWSGIPATCRMCSLQWISNGRRLGCIKTDRASATAHLDPLANCSVKSRYIIFIKFSTAKTFQQQFIITEKQTQQTPSYTPEPERVDFVLFFFFLLAASVHSIAECAAYHNVYQFMRCWSSRTTGQPFQNGLRPKKVCRLSSWSHRQTGI